MRISDWSSDVCSSDLVASLVVQGVEPPVNVRTAGPNGRMLVVEGIGDIVLRNGLKIVCIKRHGRPPQIATFTQPVRTPPPSDRVMDGRAHPPAVASPPHGRRQTADTRLHVRSERERSFMPPK